MGLAVPTAADVRDRADRWRTEITGVVDSEGFLVAQVTHEDDIANWKEDGRDRNARFSSNETQASLRGFATARVDRPAPEIPRTRSSSERSVRRGRLESVPHWRPDRYARPWIWSERRCDFPMAQQLGSG